MMPIQIKRRPVTILCTLALLLFFCSALFLILHASLDKYNPRFNLIVDMDVPEAAGGIDLYLNSNWSRAYAPDSKRSSGGKYIFHNIPNNLTHIRIDTGSKPDVYITIRAITIKTDETYTPLPGKVLFNFSPNDLSHWQISGLERSSL